ncbi:hypothetical protein, unknown function [Leishmania mexicana MHOM/GT/2001/U1103]|uniref:Uncharacterized protein n=1 Tax=Leishmania mexicana (strain MHOM/GT/2001/U1103) TaxID=929439 RepID=E9B3J9_LEIMU|nr:hypothetical protein, unknown function [Leishmania mexicana MHOM/GT/2001/U1103]CBZ29816.1 hypothetical protein, unknown function [Leishmania mexicana MHOM/GT/2001/U1103]
MTLKAQDVKHIIAWFIGVVPVCFYTALMVVCRVHRRQIAFVCAAVSGVTFFVWFVLNCASIVFAIILARSNINSAKRTREKSDVSPRGADPVRENPQTQRFTINADGSPMISQQSEDEGVLSSIPDSSKANMTAFENSSCLSSIQESSSRASVNPLHSPWQASPTMNIGLQGSPLPRGELVVAPLRETGMLSPPSFLEHLYTKDAAPVMPACPPMKPSHLQSYTTQNLGADRNFSGPGEQEKCMLKDQALSLANRLPAFMHAPTDARRASAPSTIASVRVADPSKLLRIAFMMPLVSLYMTIIITIFMLIGALLCVYDTHCLFLASPVLGLPWLWANLLVIRKAFYNTSYLRHSFHCRLASVFTHWFFMLIVYLLSVGVFAAACVLEVMYWTPYNIDGEATPNAIRVVSYFAPILIMLSIGVFLNNLKGMLGITWETYESEMVADEAPAATGYPKSPRERVAMRDLSPKVVSHGRVGRPSPSAGIGSVSGNSSLRTAGTVSAAAVHARLQPPVMSPSIPQTLPEETCSTLSSIVRSLAVGSIFIPQINAASSAKLSVNKNLLRGSHSSTNGSSDHHNGSQPAVFISSVPQLKTVTMLYVVYRDIYDDEEAVSSVFNASNQRGGMAATRNKQQTVSANFEAVMEALEDARGQDSADANSYVLTAYEDAICLVWGLIPFSSEPVLLAIEKARKIMVAFQSRPKPPTSFSNARQELVAAVVSAPHSLVGLVGSGSCRGIHFFNPRQHELGAQMLRRGIAMHRRLPSLQASLDEPKNPFHCILLDGRSWNSTASQILARPCGISGSDGPNTAVKLPRQRRPLLNVSSKSTKTQFVIIYNFMEVLKAIEEEWHLVVQRQEHLGSKFCFLSEAVQLLHQGDQNGAQQVLKGAVQSMTSSSDADNITIAKMLLEDLDVTEGGGSPTM